MTSEKNDLLVGFYYVFVLRYMITNLNRWSINIKSYVNIITVLYVAETYVITTERRLKIDFSWLLSE